MKDYYAILGVSRDASQSDIEKAFRKLAHKYHPDKKDGDAKKFKEASEAYQVLKDKNKRAQYDMTGSAGGGAGFDGFEDMFRNGGFQFSGSGFDNVQDIFSEIFRQATARGKDIQIDLSITFQESIFGTEKKIDNYGIEERGKKLCISPYQVVLIQGHTLKYQGRENQQRKHAFLMEIYTFG